MRCFVTFWEAFPHAMHLNAWKQSQTTTMHLSEGQWCHSVVIFTVLCPKLLWSCVIMSWWRRSLRHPLDIYKILFSTYNGNQIAISEILLKTQDSSSISSPTQSTTTFREVNDRQYPSYPHPTFPPLPSLRPRSVTSFLVVIFPCILCVSPSTVLSNCYDRAHIYVTNPLFYVF
jgi:hypothetical protein